MVTVVTLVTLVTLVAGYRPRIARQFYTECSGIIHSRTRGMPSRGNAHGICLHFCTLRIATINPLETHSRERLKARYVVPERVRELVLR